MKIVVCGDTHYDLNDGELKRTEDIDRTFNEIIDEAINQEADIFVHCGDVFDNNRPTTDSIAMAIRAFRRLEEAEIETYILVGNHDIISQAERTSALEVIDAIGFEYVKVVNFPELILKSKINLMMLPHVSKAKMVLEGFQDVDEYWETVVEEMLLKSKKPIMAFGHHNIAGAVAGSESWMIRGHEQHLPEILFESKKVLNIFNGHIHKPQVIKKKTIIVGSVECLNMGEKEEEKKYVIVRV